MRQRFLQYDRLCEYNRAILASCPDLWPQRQDVQNLGNTGNRRMQWYHYLGWMLVGMCLLFFGVGMVSGIDESQALIPILVILALAAGVILVNKY